MGVWCNKINMPLVKIVHTEQGDNSLPDQIKDVTFCYNLIHGSPINKHFPMKFSVFSVISFNSKNTFGYIYTLHHLAVCELAYSITKITDDLL